MPYILKPILQLHQVPGNSAADWQWWRGSASQISRIIRLVCIKSTGSVRSRNLVGNCGSCLAHRGLIDASAEAPPVHPPRECPALRGGNEALGAKMGHVAS